MENHNLTRDEVKSRVIEIICHETGYEEMIEDELEFYLLDIDSLKVMDIIIAIENEFKIQISDTEVLSMETFGKMMSIILRKLQIE